MSGVAPIASEQGHWYLPDGTPFYTVPYANGKGERPATLKDARKVGAFPSVTTILKVAAAPGLEHYFQRQIFDAVLRLPRRVSVVPEVIEDSEAYFERVREASREHSKAAADKGTALHGAIEQFLRGEPITDKSYSPHVANIAKITCQYGLDVRRGEPEKSFAHKLGFGGKVDLHWGSNPLYDDGVIIDFKSKPNIEPGKKYAYSNHAMQLAAYRNGLGLCSTARCINIFVGIEDKEVLIHEWPEKELGRAWARFLCFLHAWQLEPSPGSEPYSPTNTHEPS